MTPEEEAELDNRTTWHAPTDAQIVKYQHLRGTVRGLYRDLMELCPDSRERSLALTHLDEVTFWANASIARRS